MCGIAGTIGRRGFAGGASIRELISEMNDVIFHRGPDEWGFHLDEFPDGEVAIGMRRLSIIDVASGRQPITNEDGNIWIVFNGEIYNHHELRKGLVERGHRFSTRSDTETILHLYEEEGDRCVEKLRGMFGFAIWDSRDHSVFLARDRAGKKPMHYTLVGDTLVFGSELKSLFQHPSVKREVNLQAISDFLSFGYIPDPATAFQNIHKLPPAHTLRYRNGQITLRKYWDFTYGAEEPTGKALDEREYIERLRELLFESVKIRLESEVPLGAFLSGGVDSSATVAMMSRAMNQPVKTFSIGFSEAGFDELKYARVTAEAFKTDHHEFVVTPDVCNLIEEVAWHHDEPFGDVSSIPTYVVSKMAREHVTVVLTGDGGDEVFGGYERYVIERLREKFEHIPSVVRRNLMQRLSNALPRGFYGKRYLSTNSKDAGPRFVDALAFFDEEAKRSMLSPEVRSRLGGYNSATAYERIFESPQSQSRLHRQMYLDSKTYLPGDVLAKVDRMSMAHSIETRSPLLDHKLIEFAQTIPASLKLRRTERGFETKYIFKRALEGIIPQEIIYRRKQGFDVPIKHWLRNELSEMLDDTICSQSARQRGYFDHRVITGILDEHRRGVRDNARHLWGLMMLEIWHRLFIDRRPERRFDGAKEVRLDQLTAGSAA